MSQRTVELNMCFPTISHHFSHKTIARLKKIYSDVILKVMIDWLIDLSLALSLIQQICSRRLWKYFDKKMEYLNNWKDNLWLKVENIASKGEIARFEQFLLFTIFSKSRLLQRRQKASIWGKGLKTRSIHSKRSL